MAQAEIVYYFGGSLSGDVAGFATGTPFQGSFRYDENQSYENMMASGDGWIGASISYSFFEVSIGGQSLLANSTFPRLAVDNAGTLSIFRHPWTGENYQANGIFVGFGITLKDFSLEKINLSRIPDSSLRLSNLNEAFLKIGEYVPVSPAGYNEIKTVNSNLTFLVPEPSSLSLFLAGGAVLMAGRRKNRIRGQD